VDREYEVKLLAEGSSFAAVVAYLKTKLIASMESYSEGSSIDAYWKPAPGTVGDFIRLRVGNECVLTSKINDKLDITNRAEHNVTIDPSQKDVLAEMLTSVLGEPDAIMWRYVDFEIASVGAVISVIQNLDKPAFTFVEIECHHFNDVAKWRDSIASEGHLTLKQVKNSFYDIFVLKHGVRL